MEDKYLTADTFDVAVSKTKVGQRKIRLAFGRKGVEQDVYFCRSFTADEFSKFIERLKDNLEKIDLPEEELLRISEEEERNDQ